MGDLINPVKGRAELADIVAVPFNPIALAQFPHTILGSIMVATAIIVSVAAWHLSRGQHFETMRPALGFTIFKTTASRRAARA